MQALDLGLAPYPEVQLLQKRLRAAVACRRLDGVLLLLEHPPVITLGKTASLTDIRDPNSVRYRKVQVVRSERGGQSTIHAPGQLVAYPVLTIPRRDLRAYVHDLEEVLLTLLAAHGLVGATLDGRPGVYARGRKIASVGLRCQHGIASHGTALNVTIDLALFDLVITCGDPLLRHTSMEIETASACSIVQCKTAYMAAFAKVFGIPLESLVKLPHDAVGEYLGLST